MRILYLEKEREENKMDIGHTNPDEPHQPTFKFATDD